MQLFGLKNCDTCRKALKMLPEAELRDVRAEGVPAIRQQPGQYTQHNLAGS